MKKSSTLTTATFADLMNDLLIDFRLQHRSRIAGLRFTAEQRRAIACGETAGKIDHESQSCGAATSFALGLTSLLRSFALFCASNLGLAPKPIIRSSSAAKAERVKDLRVIGTEIEKSPSIVGTPSPQFVRQPENAEFANKTNSGVADSRIQAVTSTSPTILEKCSVLVELKLERFSHENLGQLNTYVSWFRAHMMTEGDNPPVGILLCTDKNHALAEYALAGMYNQLFVAKYQLELPKKEEMKRFIDEQLKEVTQDD